MEISEVTKEDLDTLIRLAIEDGNKPEEVGVFLMGAGAGLCKSAMSGEKLREIFEDGLKELGI